MIVLADENNKKDIMQLCGSAAVSACRISCIMKSYGSYPDLADLWVQYSDDNKPSAAVVKYSGNITVYCTDKADIRELREFSEVIGYGAVESETELFENSEQAVIMRKTGEISHRLPESDRVLMHTADPDYKKIYSLMKSCSGDGFEVPPYENFITEFSHRLRHNTAKFCCAEKDREIISFAMTAALSSTAALIGSVCTLPPYRKRGIGRACLSHLISGLGSREIFIIRQWGKNQEFYTGLGFEDCGKWHTNV